MKAKEKKKGISLIVLVITIIVIIVLAVAVILTVAKNNPIENAKEAVKANDKVTAQEVANMAYLDWYTKKELGEEVSENARDYVGNELTAQGFSESQVNHVLITNDGIKEVKEPVIPNEFKHKEGTISEGYVIENETDGNEFVWVPVEDISEFVREEGYYNGTLDTMLADCSEPFTNARQDEKDEYHNMKKSVEKYGGFYIARYEASQDTETGKAQSKPNQTPWVSIKWGTSMTNLAGGAVDKARAMYPVENATKEKDAVSTLIYGTQWDAAVRWLKSSYPEIEKDSTKYGNYSNNTDRTSISPNDPAKTGACENWKTNNIYDLAGNVWEWTMEVYSTDFRIYRGGNYFLTGSHGPVSRRILDFPGSSSVNVGFRPVLYIK